MVLFHETRLSGFYKKFILKANYCQNKTTLNRKQSLLHALSRILLVLLKRSRWISLVGAEGGWGSGTGGAYILQLVHPSRQIRNPSCSETVDPQETGNLALKNVQAKPWGQRFMGHHSQPQTASLGQPWLRASLPEALLLGGPVLAGGCRLLTGP